MTYAADLHLHSPYARATSKFLTFENMGAVGAHKGHRLAGERGFYASGVVRGDEAEATTDGGRAV